MSDCATRGPINKLETDFTYAYKKKIFSEKNREWLKVNGYVDNDGNVIIEQLSKSIYLTPRQCLELVEVLKVVRGVTGESK